MRILYTFRSLAVWGGIERVLVDKMNYLVNVYGYEIYMLTTDQGEHSIPYPIVENVHFEDLGIQFYKQYSFSGFRRLFDAWQRTCRFEKRLSERIRKIQPDVLVCTTSDPINSIVRAKGSIPLIVESHSICTKTLGGEGLRRRFIAKLLQKGLKRADCIVALTESDAIEWREIHPIVKVIPDMVHLNDGLGSSLLKKRVIWVGRYDYQKRPMEIIRIWQITYPHFPEWHLDIYGEGDYQQELENTSQSLRMNIHVHHPTDKIFDAYKDSSILVSTSLFEPFGLVIPEAMSCGLPVVAYNCPYGPSLMITDGANGFLINNDDCQDFVKKLSLLMSDYSLRQRMGKTAARSVQHFSAERIMPMWRELFHSLLPSQ